MQGRVYLNGWNEFTLTEVVDFIRIVTQEDFQTQFAGVVRVLQGLMNDVYHDAGLGTLWNFYATMHYTRMVASLRASVSIRLGRDMESYFGLTINLNLDFINEMEFSRRDIGSKPLWDFWSYPTLPKIGKAVNDPGSTFSLLATPAS